MVGRGLRQKTVCGQQSECPEVRCEWLWMPRWRMPGDESDCLNTNRSITQDDRAGRQRISQTRRLAVTGEIDAALERG